MNISETIQQLREVREEGDRSLVIARFKDAVAGCESTADFDKLLWWIDDLQIGDRVLAQGLYQNSSKNPYMQGKALERITDTVVFHNFLEWVLAGSESISEKFKIYRGIQNKSGFEISAKKVLLHITGAVKENPSKDDCCDIINGWSEYGDYDKAITLFGEFSQMLIPSAGVADDYSQCVDLLLTLGEKSPEKMLPFVEALAKKSLSISTNDLWRLFKFSRGCCKTKLTTQKKLLSAIKSTIHSAEQEEKRSLEMLIVAGRFFKHLGNDDVAEEYRDLALILYDLDAPDLRLIYDTFFWSQYDWEKIFNTSHIQIDINRDEPTILCTCCACDEAILMLPEDLCDKTNYAKETGYFYVEGKVGFAEDKTVYVDDNGDWADETEEKLVLNEYGELDVSDTPKPKTIHLDAIYCPECNFIITALLGDDALLGPYYFDDEEIAYEPSGGSYPDLRFVVEPVTEIYLPEYIYNFYTHLEEHIEAKSFSALCNSGRL